MIRSATNHDIDAVEQIFMEFFAWSRKFGRTTPWVSGVYPTRTTIRRAVAKGELFALWDDRGEGRKIYACIAISREMPEEYATVRWKFFAPQKGVCTARLLCVSPFVTRQTMGTQLLHYAIRSAAKMRCRALRLDVWAQSEAMNALCAKLGFRLAATRKKSPFPGAETSDHNFYEYEIRPNQ